MVMEEELKELKEFNEDLQQKLASAEEMYETTVESHSREITESNEKVYNTIHMVQFAYFRHMHCSALTWSSD